MEQIECAMWLYYMMLHAMLHTHAQQLVRCKIHACFKWEWMMIYDFQLLVLGRVVVDGGGVMHTSSKCCVLAALRVCCVAW